MADEQTKPGWMSTELWATVGTVAGAFVVAVTALNLPADHWAVRVAAVLGALAAAGYLVGRYTAARTDLKK